MCVTCVYMCAHGVYVVVFVCVVVMVCVVIEVCVVVGMVCGDGDGVCVGGGWDGV